VEASLDLSSVISPFVSIINHRFAFPGSLGIFHDILAAGAAGEPSCGFRRAWPFTDCTGLEAVVIFERSFDNSTGALSWGEGTLIRSSDFDYDIINGVQALHSQGFGTAVSIANRTLVVGSPHADYNKIGTDYPDTYDTAGTDPLGFGKGKAYVFYRYAEVYVLST
jgi:hypothetical protein